jgi:hypothetical protein
MKFVEATEPHRKSGMCGTQGLLVRTDPTLEIEIHTRPLVLSGGTQPWEEVTSPCMSRKAYLSG